MGWTEAAVAAASLWRFNRAFRGWRLAQGGEETPAHPTEDAFAAALAAMSEEAG